MPAHTSDPPRRMTVEEFLALPEPETGHHELVEGEVVVSFPTLAHQDAVLNLAAALKTWTRAADGRGRATLEIDTQAGSTSILGPDVQWYAGGRDLGSPHERPKPLGDLIVEVRSPSTWSVDVGAKKRLYEQHGVRELWLVDPLSQTVLVFSRSTPETLSFDVAADLGPDDTVTSPLLPGFTLAVAEIFA